MFFFKKMFLDCGLGGKRFRTTKTSVSLKDKGCMHGILRTLYRKTRDGLIVSYIKRTENECILRPKNVLANIYLLHAHSDLGSVGVVGWDRSYLVNYVHSRNYLAECSVLSVKMGGIVVHDEELA